MPRAPLNLSWVWSKNAVKIPGFAVWLGVSREEKTLYSNSRVDNNPITGPYASPQIIKTAITVAGPYKILIFKSSNVYVSAHFTPRVKE